jgi:ABC-type branched-subunit amino acid transport system substrate-binding protein
VAVIGPGADNLAGRVLDVLAGRGVPLLSPIATTARTERETELGPWIRVSVPAIILGRALANLVADSGVEAVRIAAAGDVFHQEFAQAFAERAISLGLSIPEQYTLDERRQSFGDAASAVARRNRDAILVAMNPLPAARFINEVTIASSDEHEWFLSPRLKSELFLLNIIPGALEGAVGVSPDTLLNPEEFGEVFARAWDGNTPLDGAHFSYDTAALTFTAIDRLLQQAGGGKLPPREVAAELEAQVMDLAAFGGVIIDWNDLQQAIERNDSGRDWQFSGVTGPIVLAPDGARRSGSIAAWSIDRNQIVRSE